ncbi:MAG: oxidation resistance protein 1 [Bathelium mastoideum]|nr:MAG: oxidation resistance protein 1 [Bathelium mastoideum]KAI9691199.1 MAG: oxidation resistance protein 1 [Bathelium mastoideum]
MAISSKLHSSNASSQSNSTSSSQSFVSSHLPYPVSYTVNALLRRLSSDPEPVVRAGPTDSRHSSRSSTPKSFAMDGGYTPPKRIASPFQPPPLSPLSLGFGNLSSSSAKTLTRTLAEEIRLLVPPRLQLVEAWNLAYSLERDGSSLATLYQQSDKYRGKRGGFVVVVKDGAGSLFGAYLSDPPHPSPHFFGNGECFLWRASTVPSLPTLSSLPPPPSADTTNLHRMTTLGQAHNRSANSSSVSLSPSAVPGATQQSRSGTSTPERIRFKAFPYSGVNEYMIFCETGFLSIGGGDGHYGLWLNDNLEKGVSDPCPTFGNEPLSDEGSKFDVLNVELWYVGA